MKLSFRVNRREVTVATATDRRLIDLLREDLGLTGTKEGCGEGECGACTILLDGQAVNSCLIYASQISGKSVTTIEGLATENLHPLQRAFIEKGAIQCGFCTPGFIMSAYALLAKHVDPSEDQIRWELSGNLCRCTGYTKIIAAVRYAAKLLREQDEH
ncbi:(2Fe-2S)-binding protein [Candidatus Bipolaricaulota bacterium]|nr:(2Fe-2S)-binding protein [Candidatus Bipolaricaulota bacterium]